MDLWEADTTCGQSQQAGSKLLLEQTTSAFLDYLNGSMMVVDSCQEVPQSPTCSENQAAGRWHQYSFNVGSTAATSVCRRKVQYAALFCHESV